MSNPIPNILLVDDNPDNLALLEAALCDMQLNLVKAESGHEALEYCRDHEVALILLDVQMGDLNGFDTATLLRAYSHIKDTPIVFVTAVATIEEQLLRGYSVGAVDYMFKPINIRVLRAKVSRFVDLFRKTELVRQQAEELTEAKRELEATVKELDAFAYSVSHDLRAPLRGIDGFSQVLLKNYSDKLDSQGAHYLERVRAASQFMGQLIDDLLKLSRLSRAGMHFETVDLSAIARAIADTMVQEQPERQVTFHIANGLTARGDPVLLRAALENLLSNSWKFTSRHATATIEFGATVQDGKQVYFVRDDGAGFDVSYAGKLFGAFQRLHGAKEFPGTGVGLATVQRIIHRHGGRVWAEGAVEKGATFNFTL